MDASGSEAGLVLVAVLGVGLVLSVVAGAAAVRTVALLRAADAAVARERALLAAEATVTAVVDRLGRDAVGWLAPGGPDPAAMGHGWRPLDAALRGLPAPVDAAGVAVRTDVGRVGPGPTVRIRAEARVGTHVRAVETVVRPASTADLTWGTVHAVLDPGTTGGDPVACARHRWEEVLHEDGRGPREPEVGAGSSGCVRTLLDGTLRVTGTAHLDDAPRTGPGWSPATTLTTAAPGAPQGAAPLLLPRDPFGAVGDDPVCRLRGPTLLRFDGWRVRVTSPRSHPRHDDEGGPPVRCPWLDPSELDGVAVLDLPVTAVVAVASDPAARCAAHPLGVDSAEDAVGEQRCGAGTAYVWGRYLGARSVLAEQDVQVVWDVVPEPLPEPVPTASGSSAVPSRLGLVAGGSVVVRRPVGPPLRMVAPFGTDAPFAGPGIPPFGAHPEDAPTATPTRWTAPRIVAAVAALGGGFRIQNPDRGQGGDVPIRIEGSLVQRFVGPTRSEQRDATGALQATTGRILEVVHDPGLDVAVPPALPRIRGGVPRVLTWEEVRVEATGDGH